VDEDIEEATGNFTLKVLIPALDSFIFVEEIRKKSCGVAYPQLVFAGWEINQEDPFFVP
jgi:ribosome assembly protein 1